MMRLPSLITQKQLCRRLCRRIGRQMDYSNVNGIKRNSVSKM
jgi:hypothetical protein